MEFTVEWILKHGKKWQKWEIWLLCESERFRHQLQQYLHLTWPNYLHVLCQSPTCDPPAWGTLWRGHGGIRGERVSGEDGGGAPQSFRAQFDWLAEAESPKCPDRPLVRQETAGNHLWLLSVCHSSHRVKQQSSTSPHLHTDLLT